eukprot:scaffold84256_cov66-Phaeocystis_antarctica.AAC.4
MWRVRGWVQSGCGCVCEYSVHEDVFALAFVPCAPGPVPPVDAVLERGRICAPRSTVSQSLLSREERTPLITCVGTGLKVLGSLRVQPA